MASVSTTQTVKRPYVGPNPFEEADGAIFFGREREKRDLCSLVIAHGEVLLFAQSGAGKSSLLNAGVIPLLRKKGFDVRVPARVTGTIPPSLRKGVRNSFIFNVLRTWGGPDSDLDTLSTQSLSKFLGLSDSHEQKAEADESRPEVLIFDQLEEIFEIFPGRHDEREDFFQQIGQALEASPRLRVVFSMREDYIARLTPFVSLLPGRMKTHSRLERLRIESALEAVTRPLEIALPRRSFAPGVAESLVENLSRMRSKNPEGQVEEVAGEFVEPVQLAVVCDTLWRNLSDDVLVIGEEHLKKFGDVNYALAKFYEDSLAKTVESAGVTEARLRRWFGGTLITPEGTRGTVYRGQDYTAGIPNKAVDILQDLHLIRQEQRAGGDWYELCHDRFIAPIQDSNKEWLLKHGPALDLKVSLERQAAEWEQAGRPVDKLLDAAQLADATAWLESPAASELGYSRTVAALINLSRLEQTQRLMEKAEAQALAERKRAESEHRLAETQRALADKAQELALAQKRRAREQAASRRRLQLQLYGLIVFFLVAVGFAIKFAIQRKVANEAQLKVARAAGLLASQKAADAQKLANAERDAKLKALIDEAKALGSMEEARIERKRADEATHRLQALNQSRDLSEESISNLETEPERSLLLALAGAYVTYGTHQEIHGEVRNALNGALRSSHLMMRLSGHKDHVEDAAFSPSGTLIATASKDGSIKIWNAASGRLLQTIQGNDGKILSLAFSPDDALIAATGGKAVHLWEVASGSESLPSIPTVAHPADSVAFSPDGTRIATAAGDGQVSLWDVSSRRIVLSVAGHPTSTNAVKFSPDGTRFVTGGADGTAKVWDTASGRHLLTIFTPGKSVYAVAFSPDGNYIATGDNSDSAELWNAMTGAERYKLPGHAESVFGVAFDPQGRWIATASHDRTVKIWDVRTGALLETLVGHTAPVSNVAFSPDGRSLISAAYDNTAIVWALAAPLFELSAFPGNRAMSLAFSSDGKRLASGGGGGTVKIWDVATGLEEQELPGRSGAVMGLAFSPHGRRLVTANWNNAAVQWNVASGQQTLRISRPLYCIAVSPDGHEAVTGGDDNNVRMWDLNTGHEIRTLSGHTEEVFYAAYSPDGSLLATASRDRTVKIWNTKKGVEIRTLSGYGNTVFGVTFSPDGKRLATASADGTARIWSVKGWRELATLADPSGSGVTAVAFSPDGRLLATATSSAKTARIWDAESWKLVRSLTGHTSEVWAVAFSPDGKYLATGGNDREARLWDISSGKTVHVFSGHTSYVQAVAFSPDGKSLVTGSYDRRLMIWNVKTGERVLSSEAQSSAISGLAYALGGRYLVTSNLGGVLSRINAETGKLAGSISSGVLGNLKAVAFSPDGTRFVTASTDYTAQVWKADVNSGEPLHILKGHSNYVNGVAFSSDGRYIATASGDGTVRRWNASDGSPAAHCPILKGADAFTSVALNPQGDKLVAGSEDKTAIVWDVKSCRVLHKLEGHNATVRTVAFSPDGKWIATGSDDRTVKLWDAQSGEEKYSLTGHQGKVYQVVFSPDAMHLATASEDGWIRTFSLDDAELLNLAQSHLTRQFTQAECERYMHARHGCPAEAAALSLIGEGFEQAREGNFAKSINDFENAKKEAPFLKLNPELMAQHVQESTREQEISLRAQGSLIEAAWFARYGQLPDAIRALELARQLEPDHKVPAGYLNRVCWWGSLRDQAALVLDYCEQAVNLDPSNGNIRDSRGVALVLIGRYKQAIPDFEAYAAWTGDVMRKQQRERWLQSLRNGKNPLTAEEIQILKTQ